MNFYSALFLYFVFVCSRIASAQVDTTFIYNASSSLGILDIRLSKSQQQHYYLKENQTFSFREVNGVRTNTYLNMTAWDSKAYTEGNLREVNGGVDAFTMNYRLLKPSGYNENFQKGYPLVLVLHGLLERGNCAENKCYHATSKYSPNFNNPSAGVKADHELLNNDYNLVHGGLNYLDASLLSGNRLPDDPNLPPRGFPGFVVFPQNLNGWDDLAVEDAIRIVRLLVKKYNIDEDRIYINGVSHGGHAAYKAMTRAPWLFAAGVLFSAADDSGVIAQGLADKIVGIPLWLFQGGKDLKPTQGQTERYVQQFRNKGASVRYTLYPELGHGTWNKAFSEPDFFTWMLGHRKNNIQVYADNPVICKTTDEGALLSLPEGFKAYEWQHNGIAIGTQSKMTAHKVGNYRGRFLKKNHRDESWSDWSEDVEVVSKDPGAAEVQTNGTRFLPDPNGNDSVKFSSVKEHDIYTWYKDNNSRLRFDDTTKNVTITSLIGDGIYFLKASDFDKCPTRPSIPRQIYFSNRAPLSILPPTALALREISPTQIQVTWIDNSTNESGFEIWRRRKISNGAFEDWRLAGIAGDTTIFVDSHLAPSSFYEYQIRAISETARSVYFPQATEIPISVTTQKDDEQPSAPMLLTVEQVGIVSVALAWRPSTDNSAVTKYLVIMNSDTIQTKSNDTTLIVDEIAINTNYVMKVVAVDAATNLSVPSNKKHIHTMVDGLFYQHSTGVWETLQEIDWSLAEFRGSVPSFSLSPKTQQDFFNFRFDGFLRIVKEGIYQFRISSDDGSSLILDDSVLVVNDGIHNLTTTTSPIQLLTSGPHRIRVDFFDHDRSDSLLIEYKGPDSENQWISIPAKAFTSNLITTVETETEQIASVYPNPTTADNINVMLPDLTSPVMIRLSNSTGQQLHRAVILPGELENVYRLETHSLLPGLYLITVQQQKYNTSIRVIIK